MQKVCCDTLENICVDHEQVISLRCLLLHSKSVFRLHASFNTKDIHFCRTFGSGSVNPYLSELCSLSKTVRMPGEHFIQLHHRCVHMKMKINNQTNKHV